MIISRTAFPVPRPVNQGDASPKSCREAGDCVAGNHDTEPLDWMGEGVDLAAAIELHYEKNGQDLNGQVAVPAGHFVPFAMNCKMVLIIDDREEKSRPDKKTLRSTYQALEKWRADGAGHMRSYKLGELVDWVDDLALKGPRGRLTKDFNVEFKFVCLDSLPFTAADLYRFPDMPILTGLAKPKDAI